MIEYIYKNGESMVFAQYGEYYVKEHVAVDGESISFTAIRPTGVLTWLGDNTTAQFTLLDIMKALIGKTNIYIEEIGGTV